MSRLIDSQDLIIKEGTKDYIEDLYRVLNASVYDVSEDDEVKFGDDLYLTWNGKLKVEHDKYVITGTLVNGRRFTPITTETPQHYNVWKGSLWKLVNGKRKLIHRYYNG
jgi:hypothetical protein